ncbi:MAG: Gfo/Idh/MocA family oxidoreductase [Chloroflexi bacterium]|nr:Gfo/Idh/MocA family oxidoreductase [Chloroflexota bacterium]
MPHVKREPIRCAIVGYGGTFNWGEKHASWIRQVAELELTAICDRDPARAALARQTHPELEVYQDLADVLRRAPVDLVTINTPHHTHASLAVECLRAGKHVVVEKPFCISVAEADAMIAEARRAGRMLSVSHNRRLDGNVAAIVEAVARGLIGEVFQAEVATESYRRPPGIWRDSKELSGGVLYDWGSHAIDWMLHVIPRRMVAVTGFLQKRVWHEVTNEDQATAIIHFEGGVIGQVSCSRIAAVGRPLWRVLGTSGAIADHNKGTLSEEELPTYGASTLVRVHDGERTETDLPWKRTDRLSYYLNVTDHILRGAPLRYPAEDGRRVITVLETMEKSARSGQTERVPYD